MAETRITASERLAKDCFIEVRGKASYQSCVKSDTQNSDGSGVSDLNISAIIKEISNDTNGSDSNKIENGTERQEYTEIEAGIVDHEDDKSDYGESFYSEDSYKGSEMTNVTPRSSLSGCSSLLQSAGLNYNQRITELLRSRRNSDQQRDDYDDEERLSFAESGEERLTMNRGYLTHSRRINMSFTNDELRKIERENELLLKKIMSHQKPQSKIIRPLHGASRASSSAVNRKKQQKKIEADNMVQFSRLILWIAYWSFDLLFRFYLEEYSKRNPALCPELRHPLANLQQCDNESFEPHILIA